MTKAVGADMLVDAGSLYRFVEEFVDKLSGEVLAPSVKEDIDLFAGEGRDMASDGEDIGGEHSEGMTVDGNPSLFVSFANHMKRLFVDKKVGQP